MVIHGAQNTDAELVSMTVNLQRFLMLRADLLLESFGGLDQPVVLKGRRYVVRLEVSLTVRGQTDQAGLHGFLFPPSAEIALHVSRF